MNHFFATFVLLFGLLPLECGGSHLSCGPGTHQVGNQCEVSKPPPDPLVGTWTADNGYQCSFYPNSAWDCYWQNGWPSSWQKLGDNWYYFGISNGPSCDGRTTFSADTNKVSIALNCHGHVYDNTMASLTRAP
jgi:hypothetical protein